MKILQLKKYYKPRTKIKIVDSKGLAFTGTINNIPRVMNVIKIKDINLYINSENEMEVEVLI